MAEEADLLGLNEPMDDDEFASFASMRAANREQAPILPEEELNPAQRRGRTLLDDWERGRESSRSPQRNADRPPPAPLPHSPLAVPAGAEDRRARREQERGEPVAPVAPRVQQRSGYRDCSDDEEDERAFQAQQRAMREGGGGDGSYFDRLGFGRRPRPLSYAVTFENGPIGLELETDWYGRQAVVKGFKKGLRGEDMPAKACGKIHVGDVLTSVNGESVLELSFQETLTRLRELSNSRHTLVFKDLEAAGDLSIYAGDMELREARMFIHEHKMRFYEPPPESDEMVYACVERHRGQNVCAFNLHREDTGEFLLAASCDAEMTGPFVFHTLQDSYLRTMSDIPRSEDSAVYLGSSDANFLGTEFTVHDHRVDLSEAERPMHELGLICYETNILGRVPNFLKAIVPRLTAEGSEQAAQSRTIMERYQTLKATRRKASLMDAIRNGLGVERPPDEPLPPADEAGSEFADYKAVEQVDAADLLIFQTKKPTWNEELCAWTLNFNGRVKQASKKNFLIVAERGNDRMEDEFGEDKVFLRFGKMSKSRFTLDFRYPLSPMLALAIASTAFAKKLAVT